MKSLFNDNETKEFANDPLAMRVYTSRLLGSDQNLVLHGGGNTSVKIEDTIYVKGSGWDLATIEKEGFSPVDLQTLINMASYETLSDADMVKEQREALRDSSAPNPSIEAILHAIIPYDFVDHTHTDAVVTISNTPEGKARISELYGPNMLIIDYVMPGFILAKTIFERTQNIDWNTLGGIVLLNHGLFTFDNDAKKSYEKMIHLVDLAEQYLETHAPLSYDTPPLTTTNKIEELTQIVSIIRGCELTVKHDTSAQARHFSTLTNLDEILKAGPLTPEHVIRTKPFPVIIDDDVAKGLREFNSAYEGYFRKHKSAQIRLDLAPRYAIIKGYGFITLAANEKESTIIYDIVQHTQKAMLQAEMLSCWKSITPADIFDMEYWELEQAKLGVKKNKGEKFKISKTDQESLSARIEAAHQKN
jgi:rhamnose utilization protein RhaD (predicted bifunctional aldolase and dehydrogenase)